MVKLRFVILDATVEDTAYYTCINIQDQTFDIATMEVSRMMIVDFYLAIITHNIPKTQLCYITKYYMPSLGIC